MGQLPTSTRTNISATDLPSIANYQCVIPGVDSKTRISNPLWGGGAQRALAARQKAEYAELVLASQVNDFGFHNGFSNGERMTSTPDPAPTPEPTPAKPQARNPLHGKTLEAIVTELAAHYGWEELGARIPVRCFTHDPSVGSSLKFLRKTPWAREKVEGLYLFMLREQRRQGG